MSQIKNFISEIKNFGIARKNSFEMVISPPTNLDNAFNVSNIDLGLFGSTYLNSVKLRTQSGSIPERTFNLARRASRGIPVFVPVGSETTPLQARILSSEDYGEYLLLSTWNSLIMNNQNGVINFPNQYYGTIDLYLPNIEKSLLHIRFLDAFPKNLPQIDVDSSVIDQLLEFTVTFQYKRFINLTIGEN